MHGLGVRAAAVAKPFTLNASTSSVSIGSVPADAKLMLVVTDATAAPAFNQLWPSSPGRRRVTGAGVWVANAPGSITANATVAANLSGNREISGYVLVGQELRGGLMA